MWKLGTTPSCVPLRSTGGSFQKSLSQQTSLLGRLICRRLGGKAIPGACVKHLRNNASLSLPSRSWVTLIQAAKQPLRMPPSLQRTHADTHTKRARGGDQGSASTRPPLTTAEDSWWSSDPVVRRPTERSPQHEACCSTVKSLGFEAPRQGAESVKVGSEIFTKQKKKKPQGGRCSGWDVCKGEKRKEKKRSSEIVGNYPCCFTALCSSARPVLRCLLVHLHEWQVQQGTERKRPASLALARTRGTHRRTHCQSETDRQ